MPSSPSIVTLRRDHYDLELLTPFLRQLPHIAYLL